MIGDLFDSPWKVLILAVVILVLFGSRKLPEAARSLGRSMRILKREIHDLHDEETAPPAVPASQPAVTAPPAPAQVSQAQVSQAQVSQQAQVEQLQRQIDELRRQSSSTAEVQQTHQAS